MLREITIRAFTRWSWRASPRRLAAGMQRFAEVEADSAWQLLQALRVTSSPTLRARLFGNALEELHHAALFHRLARRYAAASLPLPTARRRQLYAPARGLAPFSAYLYVSEGAVYRQFFAYAAAARDEAVRQTFLDIRGDEAEHEGHAWRELVTLAGSEARARRLAGGARLRRLYEGWLRFGKVLGALPAALILAVVYFLAAPLAAGACRRLIRRAQWTDLAQDVPAAEAQRLPGRLAPGASLTREET